MSAHLQRTFTNDVAAVIADPKAPRLLTPTYEAAVEIGTVLVGLLAIAHRTDRGIILQSLHNSIDRVEADL